MRLIFAGTPAVAVPSLLRLLDGPHEVVAVLTREDAPLGRKRILTPSPVAQAAAEARLPVLKANRLTDETTAAITGLAADLGVIVAYGGFLREPLLSAPRHGWINLHFSLLPAWRGAAPVQHALIAGDTVGGASVFQLVRELDAGDVYATLPHAIDPDATAGRLLDELALSGATFLADIVDRIAAGTITPVPQAGDVSLAPKLSIDDGRIDWTAPAEEVYNRYRGVTPEPGAHTRIDGARFKILDARRAPDLRLPPGRFDLVDSRVVIGTATTALELLRVQPAGKPAMSAADWWRGLGRSPAILAE
ncbi:methionyl-tRNA formyltransferase [Mycetocola sp. CAN_C7]|uniref:methionyl-tRNA formyltransferase n=1 Tax=Mycetocola sp. CAN_C7 TaxID=2787724 RepID=UPI0018CBABC4